MTALDHLPPPDPDMRRLEAVLRRRKADRVPLVELAVADEVLEALAGQALPRLPADPVTADLHAWASARIRLWHRLGYDYYRVRADIPLRIARGGSTETSDGGRRVWSNEGTGIIAGREDFERYPWPDPSDIDLSRAEAAVECLLPGMGAIGFVGGVLEHAVELLGLTNLAMLLYDEPDLVEAVIDRVGTLVLAAIEGFCGIDGIPAVWLGDDLGFKTSTLIGPEHLRRYVLPWHRRCAEAAHARGRLFLLHSCGKVEAVMDDLVRDVGIDAKHSFEDVIEPVERFYARWSGAIAVLGGIDVDLLSRGSPGQVAARTRAVLEACSAGGYACGSGNSVTGYVPPANYLAMVQAVHRFNGRMP